MMSRTGRCTASLRTNVTRETCCGDGAPTTAWSPRDLSPGELFFWMSLGGGVSCKPCKVSCEGVQCGKGMRCVMRRAGPACVCAPTCSRRKRQMGAVCGSDGRTYRSVCRLARRQCRKDKQLAVEYFGKCQENCNEVQCPGRKSCLLDQVLRPHCVRCQGYCSRSPPGQSVCGADNSTYPSSCHIRQAACVKRKAVPLAYKGKCRAGASCDNVQCGRGKNCLLDPRGGPPRCVTCPGQCRTPATEVLCATNNFTYATWCHMMQDACKHGVLLEAKHQGPCEEGTPHQTNLIPLSLYDSQRRL